MSHSAEGYSPWQSSGVWIPGCLIRWPFLSSLPWPRARLRNWVMLMFHCQACETVTFQMLSYQFPVRKVMAKDSRLSVPLSLRETSWKSEIVFVFPSKIRPSAKARRPLVVTESLPTDPPPPKPPFFLIMKNFRCTYN